MALPQRPVMQFRFWVDLGTGDTEGPQAGFQEVSGIGSEVTTAEYRNGNDRDPNVRKVSGLNKATDVTLKRGVIGALDLYQWLDQVRSGDPNAIRTVTIHLRSEDNGRSVLVWRLSGTRPGKYVGSNLNAKGTDVAMEELTLIYERMELELG
jgi:phage tail-like protein